MGERKLKKHQAAVVNGLLAIILAVAGIFLVFKTHCYWNIIWIAILLFCGGTTLNTATHGEQAIWQQLLADTAATGHAQVLDLGNGYSTPLITIAKGLEAPGKVTEVSGIDNEEKAHKELKGLKEKVQKAALFDRIDIANTSMLNMPFTDHSFDYVTLSFTLQEITPAITRGRALQEAARALSAQGTILIVDTGDFTSLKAVLANIGFKDIRIKDAGINGWWSGPWRSTKIMIAKRR